ncbi:MAG: serine/threonine protein kinase, partial [Proteobacteria bacterium]|nr:serine/threonine protein kinase [Pseudomonadota bacterium]
MNNNIEVSIITPTILLNHGYQYQELIGEGANGKTYKAKNLKTGEIVAVKELKFSDNLKNYELFEREAETLKTIHTPGTPHFYDYITGEKEFTECWLVQEYVNGKSILDKMENGEKFDEVKTLKMMLQTADIVRMLQTMYTPPIIHRDIKPSNILVRNTPKDGMTYCLIDFGAVANPQRRGINSTVAGTVGYMAPEQLLGDCAIQSDYYAIGATALHMLTGTPPSSFTSDGFKLQFEKQLKACVPEIHKETVELLRKLLDPDTSGRPQNSVELIKLISNALKVVDNVATVRNELVKKSQFIEKYYSYKTER